MRPSTVFIMRHARAADQRSGESDYARPLVAAGSDDALAMGQWLRRAQPAPAKVLSSPALRARMTAEAVLTAWDRAPPAVEWTEELYLAELSTLIGMLEAATVAPMATLSPILMIGHNPGLEDLVTFLLPGIAEQLRGAAVMPTAGVYVIEYRLGDLGLRQGSGSLKARMSPAELAAE